MYIRRIVCKNIGPLSSIDFTMPFNSDGNPKPLILVGENGSGKSTFLSNIVDSFYEIAHKEFSNAVFTDPHSFGNVYYKMLSSLEVQIGKKYLLSFIQYDEDMDYICKVGELDFPEFQKVIGNQIEVSGWGTKDSFKLIQNSKSDKIKKMFNEDIICYFGPERYEKPFWMGNPYYDEEVLHLSLDDKIAREINNPITATSLGKNNIQWLLDIVADSRIDPVELAREKQLGQNNHSTNTQIMGAARTNVETIMSQTLGKEVYFSLNIHAANKGRFNIKRKEDGEVVAPTLDSLSTGQLALFDLFATIIRYADTNRYLYSIGLGAIQGIVVIDELELHLHPSLQVEVLPKLIQLFPKVQFIITTHSPLFLLGMEAAFGPDGYLIYQLPEGVKIGAEEFSEFKSAYKYFSDTKLYQSKIIEEINKFNTSTIIITEGKTDWMHMEAAYNNLSSNPMYADVFDGLDFKFLENKKSMGDKNLCKTCELLSKLPTDKKIICIADADDKDNIKNLGGTDKKYKKWNANLYSFVLPVPESRKNTPQICIEHYYSDKEIKTVYQDDNASRRLFMGNEFDERGVSQDHQYLCANRNSCGPSKISIIEGSDKDRVTRILDDQDKKTNYALPKSKFAELILNQEPPFDHFDFTNFLEIFKIIKEISEEN